MTAFFLFIILCLQCLPAKSLAKDPKPTYSSDHTHAFSEWIVKTPADVGTSGVRERKCMICGFEQEENYMARMDLFSLCAGLFTWMEYDIETDSWTYDNSNYTGTVTKENIDRLIVVAVACDNGVLFGNCPRHSFDDNEEYVSWTFDVPLKVMQNMFYNAFGIENVDFSLSKRYDPDREILYYIEGWGSGPQKVTESK